MLYQLYDSVPIIHELRTALPKFIFLFVQQNFNQAIIDAFTLRRKLDFVKSLLSFLNLSVNILCNISLDLLYLFGHFVPSAA